MAEIVQPEDERSEVKVVIEVLGPTAFTMSTWSDIKEYKGILFLWIRQTSVANVISWFSITLKWGWPPIRWVNCFTSDDEEGKERHDAS